MNDKPENPLAFPNSVQPDFQYAERGMTLRDYFASNCPITWTEFLIGWKFSKTALTTEALEAWCDMRFDYADAMLKARGK